MSNTKVTMIVSEGISTQVDNINQQKQMIINPMIKIRVKFIPTALSFGVTILIANLEDSLHGKLSVSIKHKETGDIIYSAIDQEYNFNLELENFVINLSLNNVDIVNAGEYLIELTINEENYTDSFFIVN